MAKQAFQPVQTSVGFLFGRDAIYLDALNVDIGSAILELRGSFNGNLASEPVDGFVDYTLTFYGVLALKIIELDSWDYSSASSFDEIVESDWCKELRGKVTPSHKHYLVQTYDAVIDVVCRRFDLVITEKINGPIQT